MTDLLHQAHADLFRRPAEEHFESFAALRTDAADQRRRSREVEARNLSILFGESGDVYFGDHAVQPTHFSMTQLAAAARVPMPVLARLDVGTRSSVLNQTFERNRRFRIGLADGDSLRAVTSDRYERVWDEELYETIDRWLLPSGFIPAVPTINTDANHTNAMGNTKAALFRSDRDSFAFFYSDKTPNDAFGGLRKGIVVFNSEVGAKCLGYATFLFRDLCSNFLVWGATGYCERTARHTSSVRPLFMEFDRELRAISNQVSPTEYSVIERAARTPFVAGNDRKAAEDRLVKQYKVSPKIAPDVVDAVFLPENPNELTHWGLVNGMTSVAKEMPYADDRVEMSRLAGNLMLLAK
jgi:hypothetical protein